MAGSDKTEEVGTELTPEAVASATFATVRKGYDSHAVGRYLRTVSSELRQARQAATEAAAAAKSAKADLDRVTTERDKAVAANAQAAATAAKRVSELEAEVKRLGEAAEAQDGGGGGTGENIAGVGEETARVLATAKESAQQIVRNADEQAQTTLADAREDAERVTKEANDYAENSARRLAQQSVEVRDRLREEVRRVRAEVGEEAEGILARAREDAARMVDDARTRTAEDGTEIAPVEDAVRRLRNDAERQSYEITTSAREKAEAMLAHARQTRRKVVGELNRERVALETHIQALHVVQERLQRDVSMVRETFAEVLNDLERLKLHDVEMPSLDNELVPLLDVDSADAMAAVDEVVVARDVPGDAEVSPEQVETSEVELTIVGSLPDEPESAEAIEEQVDELFTRVAHQKPTGAPPPADDSPDWGFIEDADAGSDESPTNGSDTAPNPVSAAERRRRLASAFDALADDETAATAAAPAPPVTEAPPPAPVRTVDPADRDRLVAANKAEVSRKLKRAMQDAENACLDAQRNAAALPGADAFTPAALELIAPVLDEIEGNDVAARAVLDAWWDKLAPGLADASSASDVNEVFRKRRRDANKLATEVLDAALS